MVPAEGSSVSPPAATRRGDHPGSPRRRCVPELDPHVLRLLCDRGGVDRQHGARDQRPTRQALAAILPLAVTGTVRAGGLPRISVSGVGRGRVEFCCGGLGRRPITRETFSDKERNRPCGRFRIWLPEDLSPGYCPTLVPGSLPPLSPWHEDEAGMLSLARFRPRASREHATGSRASPPSLELRGPELDPRIVL